MTVLRSSVIILLSLLLMGSVANGQDATIRKLQVESLRPVKKYVPDFMHIETGKHLDQKM